MSEPPPPPAEQLSIGPDQAPHVAAPSQFKPRPLDWLTGPILLAVSIGLQGMIAGFTLFGPADRSAFLPGLTQYGRAVIRPEHDLAIYLASLVGTTFLAAALAAWAKWTSRKAADADAALASSARWCQAVAVGGFAVFWMIFNARYPARPLGVPRAATGPADGFLLFLPGVLSLVVATVDLWTFHAASRAPGQIRKWAVNLLEVTAPVLLVLTLFILPEDWPVLAGRNYVAEKFHHWSFFGMGPALALAHGLSFAQFYSQYGIGWPLVFAKTPGIDLLYSRMLGAASLYGCFYFVCFYGLARWVLRSAVWAAVAVGIAIHWQMFCGIASDQVQWFFPSSTLLRSPTDVLFFLCLAAYLRKPGIGWAGLAGVAAGVGLIFETDTGIYLLAAYLFFWLIADGVPIFRSAVKGHDARRAAMSAIAFVAAVAIVYLGLTLIANGGKPPTAGFVSDRFAAIKAFGVSGVMLMPVSGVDDTTTLLFAAIVATYTIVIFATLGAAILDTEADRTLVFMAVLSAYGLASLLLFVGRSHPFNMFHAMAPLGLVGAWGVKRLCERAEGDTGTSIVGPALLVVVAAVLFTAPAFLNYPNLLCASPYHGGDAVPLIAGDVEIPRALLTDADADRVGELSAMARRLGELSVTKDDVAVLDQEDTLIYRLSGCKPWWGSPAIMYSFTQLDELRAAVDDFVKRRPTLVWVRAPLAGWPETSQDAMGAYYDAVREHYQRILAGNTYEIWRYAGTFPKSRLHYGPFYTEPASRAN